MKPEDVEYWRRMQGCRQAGRGPQQEALRREFQARGRGRQQSSSSGGPSQRLPGGASERPPSSPTSLLNASRPHQRRIVLAAFLNVRHSRQHNCLLIISKVVLVASLSDRLYISILHRSHVVVTTTFLSDRPRGRHRRLMAASQMVLSSHTKTADRAPTIVAAPAGVDHHLSRHILPRPPHQLRRHLLPLAASVDV